MDDRILMAHRIIWESHHGPIPAGMHIHHVDGDNRDNRIENLRLVTPAEHMRIHAGYELRDGVWHKSCRKCRQIKPLSEFHRYCYYPYDGTIYRCKECCRKESREYQRRVRAERLALAPAAQRAEAANVE